MADVQCRTALPAGHALLQGQESGCICDGNQRNLLRECALWLQKGHEPMTVKYESVYEVVCAGKLSRFATFSACLAVVRA